MLSRRSLIAGIGTSLVALRRARAQSVTDATGRALPIPASVTRVFPAGPPAAIMLYTLAPDLLIGWPRGHSAQERAFLLPEVATRPEIGRITGRGNTANLETVLTLKPDLILDVGSTSQTFVSLAERVQEQTGIPYALLDGRFAALPTAYRKLGELTRHVAQGEDLADYTNTTLDTITQRIAKVELEQRPRVYFARGPRGLETGLGGSINVETIELLARNVAGEKKGGLATVSIEQVLLWDPDVIIAIDRGFATGVRKDPAWIGVAAAQTGRVYLAPSLPFGWVDFPPSVNRLIGLWWLAKILYPQRFPENIREITRSFYARFYHVTPTEAQMDAVLDGTG